MLGSGVKSVFRNPFPNVAKVFRHEFLAGSRVFVPLYGAMFALSVLGGIFVIGNRGIDRIQSEFGSSVLQFVFWSALVVVMGASWIVTITVLARRFSRGILGDEAYLNLTLPVTVGEHLWARVLVALAWFAICSVVMGISILLLAYTYDKTTPLNLAVNIKSDESVSFWLFAANGFWFSLNVLFLCFFTMTVAHLSNDHRKLLTFLVALGSIIVFSNASSIATQIATDIYMSPGMDAPFNLTTLYRYRLSALLVVNALMTLAFLLPTQAILSKRLNLT